MAPLSAATRSRSASLLRLLAVAVIATAGMSAAGTATAPEITDGRSDVQLTPVANVAVPEIDVLSTYFASTGSVIRVTVVVDNLDNRMVDDEDLSFRVSYSDDTYVLADATADHRATGWRFIWSGCPTLNGECEAAFVSGNVTSTTIQMDIPSSYVNGTMTHTKASSILLLRDPESIANGAFAWFRDWAPNEGFGLDYEP